MNNWFKTFFDRNYAAHLHDQKQRDAVVETSSIIRALGLPVGSLLLDVACGYGRHSVELARRGYRVIGLDFSEAMLTQARRGPSVAGLAFKRGDMRRLGFDSQFDGVLNMFASFGYFSVRENERTLQGMSRALRRGGRILIDMPDRAYQDRHFSQYYWTRRGDRYVMVDAWYDRAAGRIEESWTMIGLGRRRAWRRSIVYYLYSLSQWKAMFLRAGLRFLCAYGDCDLSPVKSGRTRRLLVVGERLWPTSAGKQGAGKHALTANLKVS